tara:strand:- start:915 stop:1412 length:498 start_codon:yes stop_codon:yes gene_type:complete
MRLKSKINKIIDAIKDTDISEIEISTFWGAQKIRLKKGFESNSIDKKTDTSFDDSTSTIHEKIIENPKPQAEQTVTSGESLTEDDNYTVIKAPLVGTFYLSPKPGEPQYVSVGDKISSGNIICIIEAMKIFNEIESDFNGIIKEILVGDGQPVEYDQPLFKIEES